jgi:hypothetical protein
MDNSKVSSRQLSIDVFFLNTADNNLAKGGHERLQRRIQPQVHF